MKKRVFFQLIPLLILGLATIFVTKAKAQETQDAFVLNDHGYLEYQGVNVILGQNSYPQGHQSGVIIIQHGQRVATNGDLRLGPTPGQWQPVPKAGEVNIDREAQTISILMSYPDPSKNGKGFNPIDYPDLHFSYTVQVQPVGKSFRITVNLDEPLPEEWIGKVGFNLELFPGALFGKAYYMGGRSGIFPRQSNSQLVRNAEGELQPKPIARGNKLIIAPGESDQRMTIINENGNGMVLLDARAIHNNGWFIVRSLVPKGATKGAIQWLITPHAIEGWKTDPVVQVSQVGYHPGQEKVAVIQLDANDDRRLKASLLRISEDGGYETIKKAVPKDWGDFLRYHYLQFDFSNVEKPGMYVVRYGDYQTNPFQISRKVYRQGVWQPTLQYFLPVQMCHMRVNDRFRVWHGWCHMDDARMAPTDTILFDGYAQGPSTLTKYESGETVPGLNRGGWHDAGDYDMRIESQAGTVHGLTMAYEQFNVQYDNTTINQRTQVVEINRPDGKPDILQQIEHGLLTIVGGYQNLGRFYRGIISPTLRQYRHLGDASTMTDNEFFDPSQKKGAVPSVGLPGSPDDRLVFTEYNPGRAFDAAAALAAASRVMRGYNDTLATQSLAIAKEVWDKYGNKRPVQRVKLAVELLVTTGDQIYADFLKNHTEAITQHINQTGWLVVRTIPLINNQMYEAAIRNAVKKLYHTIQQQGSETPYGVPYEPDTWGSGWQIQHFGYKQYFLHKYFPDIVPIKYMLDALNFVLGSHPGSNVASFVSGVGAKSMIPGYGANRADWSYIPGGIGPGTALIHPDFPELLEWPFLWQQREYVIGGGTTDYLFLVLAANHVLNQ